MKPDAIETASGCHALSLAVGFIPTDEKCPNPRL